MKILPWFRWINPLRLGLVLAQSLSGFQQILQSPLCSRRSVSDTLHFCQVVCPCSFSALGHRCSRFWAPLPACPCALWVLSQQHVQQLKGQKSAPSFRSSLSSHRHFLSEEKKKNKIHIEHHDMEKNLFNVTTFFCIFSHISCYRRGSLNF